VGYLPDMATENTQQEKLQTAGGQQEVQGGITRADAPSWGRALASAGLVYLRWQPSGYALHNRPVRTKSTTAGRHACTDLHALPS